MTTSSGIALVTGAAGRIGRAISLHLGEAGYSLVLTDQTVESLADLRTALEAKGSTVAAIATDIATASGRSACIEAVSALHGNLRVLVNNAAFFADPGALDTTDEMWATMLAVNLIAPAALIRDAVPLMAENDASIINISSVRALATLACGAPYEAAKAGILALTRCLAVELRARGIRVNAVSPGTIFEGGLEGFGSKLQSDQRIAFETSQPSGDVGLPEQIATIVGFLASDQSSLINGENIVADGGALGMYAYTAALRAAERRARA